MWTPSAPELLVVLAIVLIFFGAGKLPAVFKQLGSGLKAFKDAQKEDPIISEDVTPHKEIQVDAVREAEEVREPVKE